MKCIQNIQNVSEDLEKKGNEKLCKFEDVLKIHQKVFYDDYRKINE